MERESFKGVARRLQSTPAKLCWRSLNPIDWIILYAFSLLLFLVPELSSVIPGKVLAYHPVAGSVFLFLFCKDREVNGFRPNKVNHFTTVTLSLDYFWSELLLPYYHSFIVCPSFYLLPWLTTTTIPTPVSFFLRTLYICPDPLLPPEYSQQGERSDYANWDSKSYQSSFAGSQAHLVPYDLSQVSVSQHHVPPVPSVPYQQYPPTQHLYPQHTGYSDAQEKLLKRRSVRQVNLDKGNLVIEVPVPSSIIPASTQGSERDEMTKLRYTAVTCDPDDFKASKYSLRPYLMGRRTELFIVMTMYNEDEVLFVKTMNAYVVLSASLLFPFMDFWQRHQEYCSSL